ncbi:hypothetical protein B0H19DRAFT_372101 [Mycena capillaripes]|nr:hypothetical protein B0H19DRAFT_372101 [Mycena capillaripes]
MVNSSKLEKHGALSSALQRLSILSSIPTTPHLTRKPFMLPRRTRRRTRRARENMGDLPSNDGGCEKTWMRRPVPSLSLPWPTSSFNYPSFHLLFLCHPIPESDRVGRRAKTFLACLEEWATSGYTRLQVDGGCEKNALPYRPSHPSLRVHRTQPLASDYNASFLSLASRESFPSSSMAGSERRRCSAPVLGRVGRAWTIQRLRLDAEHATENSIGAGADESGMARLMSTIYFNLLFIQVSPHAHAEAPFAEFLPLSNASSPDLSSESARTLSLVAPSLAGVSEM